MIRVRVVTTLVLMALVGCGEYPLKDSQVEESLPTTMAPITVGETGRADVRRLLGEPRLASEYWRFDLYRLSDKLLHVHWYLFPMAVSSQDVTGYVLVEYDDHGKVRAYGLASTREPSFLRYDPGDDADLVVGNVQLTAHEDSEFVAVTTDRRDSYLREYTAPERCRVVMGCAPGYWCPVRLKIDSGGQIDLPLAEADPPSALVVRDVTAGEHRIEAVPARSRVTVPGATQVTCAAGQTRFIAVELTHNASKDAGAGQGLRLATSARRQHLIATLAISAEMPEVLTGSPLLIWRDGQWLVPQEPGR